MGECERGAEREEGKCTYTQRKVVVIIFMFSLDISNLPRAQQRAKKFAGKQRHKLNI